MRFLILLLLLLLVLIRGVLSDVLPLDDSRPFLSSGGAPIAWPSGGPAVLLASSPVVRVNLRGIYTEPIGMRLRDLDRLGWARAPCNLSAFALCATEFGSILPVSPAPLVADDPSALPEDWGLLRIGCASARGTLVTHQAVYEPSACDVLDEGLDLVYASGSIYFRDTHLSLVNYWFLIVGAVVLVRGLSQNIQAHRSSSPWPSQTLPLCASAICILLVSHDGGDIYVTEGDFTFYCATMIYCLLYLSYHVIFVLYDHALGDAVILSSRQVPPVYNLAAGVMQLVASRLYTGAETPYTPVVLLILSTRAITKLRSPSAGHALTALLDAAYISLGCELGFLPAPVYLVALFTASYLLGDLFFRAF